ncbi:hypothetical protein JTE90_019044 [Oedothorax gibbosus]|uniref:Uncharacterized protein n=1 Tax=Oedothorax gibbosus TaxID=931172 RepID=A0AAV6UYM6_9ARAC|nr:hypothetical protein JTE90_019044 [Oedothorax gibbosus]
MPRQNNTTLSLILTQPNPGSPGQTKLDTPKPFSTMDRTCRWPFADTLTTTPKGTKGWSCTTGPLQYRLVFDMALPVS